MVRPEGLEPPAYWFEASRSIQLSYGRTPPSSSYLIISRRDYWRNETDARWIIRTLRSFPSAS